VDELIWDQIFKANLAEKIPMSLAAMLERWLVQFGLQETYDKWAESIMLDDEEEAKPEPEPRPEPDLMKVSQELVKQEA